MLVKDMYSVCYSTKDDAVYCINNYENCLECYERRVEMIVDKAKCELTKEEYDFLNNNDKGVKYKSMEQYVTKKYNIKSKAFMRVKIFVFKQYDETAIRMRHLGFMLDRVGYKNKEEFERAEKEYNDLEKVNYKYEAKIKTLAAKARVKDDDLFYVKEVFLNSKDLRIIKKGKAIILQKFL